MKPERLKQSNYEFGDSRDAIAEAVAKLMSEQLSSEARGFEIADLIPEAGKLRAEADCYREICADALARITTECKAGFRILARARARDQRGFVLRERFAWHCGSGSGSLYSVFGSRYRTSSEYWEFADTFAQLLAFLLSRGSAVSWSEKWGKLLGLQGGKS